MTNALQKVLEGVTLSDSAKAAIVESWETKIQEAREEIAASLRDEFALKYDKDRGELVEAMDAMIRDVLESKVKELAEAKKEAYAEKVATKKKMNETVDLVHAFAKEQLTKEVAEFRADRQAMSAKVSEVDQFIKETLTKELEGFHEDRRRLVEDRIKLKINAGKELAEAKKKMISEMASVSGKFIKNILAEEIVQLKGELIEAKKKHFGKKLFEAFAAEFGSSFFNERKELKKLFKVIEETNKKLEETKNEIVKRDAIILEERNKLRIIEDRFTRTKTMNEMCGTLTGSKRKLMEELLEKVPTNKLTESFKAYLPSVISAETSKKTELKEGRISEVTGDKDNLMSKAAKEAPEKTAINEVLGSFRKMENYANTKGTF